MDHIDGIRFFDVPIYIHKDEVEFLYEIHMKEQREPVSQEQKLKWLQKFFKRMSTALYKWTLMPPAPIVDARSVNKSEYNQPVVSSKINYKKTSFEEKLEDLKSKYV